MVYFLGELKLSFLFLKVIFQTLLHTLNICDFLIEFIFDVMNLIVLSFLVIITFGNTLIFGVYFIDVAAFCVLFEKTFVFAQTH